ncbi:Uncharacterised protein [Pannonibacter phragmitetus]|uniref:Uncharacterized protein n=1 Tax=Pannonibacter phragmitetus TaxID=121719 RepID=A0A378ZZF3_9HYPH|nr:Uncharacterised protein [Pannonibacter phragmitetus]
MSYYDDDELVTCSICDNDLRPQAGNCNAWGDYICDSCDFQDRIDSNPNDDNGPLPDRGSFFDR